MEFFERLRVFRSRGVILVLLLGVIFGTVGYLIRSFQPPVYQASVRLIIGHYINDQHPAPQDVQLANDLTSTYAQLLNTVSMRQAAILALDMRNVDGSAVTPEQLRDSIKITVGADAPFIDILASAASPDLAVKKANGLAQQLLLASPLTSSTEDLSRETLIQSQIKDLTALLDNNQGLIQALDRQTSDSGTVPDQGVSGERQTLTENVIRISETITHLEEILTTLQTPTNTIRIVDPAYIPMDAIGPRKLLVFGLGFIAGVMLGSGLLLLADDLFPSLNSMQRFKQLTGLPLLGSFPRMTLAQHPSTDWLVIHNQPLSSSSEVYRRLYVQLHQGQTRDTASVYIFNSPHTGEGKSTTAANFAVMLASAGHRVLLIDANVRHPVLHKIFEIEETEGGLARLLEASPEDLTTSSDDEGKMFFRNYIQETSIPNVSVLARGKAEDDRKIASLLLRLPRFQEWLDPLHNRFGIDVFIFDTGAYTTSSEALLLADALEGQIILVMETRGTLRQQAQEMVDQLHQTRARLVGAILNKQ